jgi:uncharacterized membrane protein YkoI
MRHSTNWIVIAALMVGTMAWAGVAGAGETVLGKSVSAALGGGGAWVLAAERVKHDGDDAVRVMVVNNDGAVWQVIVAADGARVLEREPTSNGKAKKYAAKVLAAAGGKAPDLSLLITRVEGFTRGADVMEAELELEHGRLAAEVECRRDGLEIELAFDPATGALVGMEIEAADGEDEDDEDEDGDEDEGEGGDEDGDEDVEDEDGEDGENGEDLDGRSGDPDDED